jgi:hypothetical protein
MAGKQVRKSWQKIGEEKMAGNQVGTIWQVIRLGKDER